MESQESIEDSVSKTKKDNADEAKVVYKTISGGLITSLIKSVLQHGIFWIVIYILGFFNFNWKWTILPLAVSTFVEEKFLNIKTPNKSDKTKSIPVTPPDKNKKAVLKEKILARIQDLPNWVLFPDFERSEWFNQILDQLWAPLEGLIVTKVVEDVEPVIQDLSPIAKAIKFSRCTLGKIPPRIGGIKVYPGKKVVSRNEVIMDMNLVWASDCDIRLSAKFNQLHIPTLASISGISFEGNVRVELTPLINEPPLFAGLKVSLLEEPKINFSSNGLASVASIPGLSRVIKKVIIQQISRVCVMPNNIFVPLKHPMPQQIDRCPDPAGLLRVEIVQALDLMAKDKRLTAKDTSDPYAVFGIGENDQGFRTKIIEKELNPVWNKYGEFAFQSEDFSEDCDLHINVWDKDKIGSDDSLGDIVVPISKMKNRRKRDFWENLDNATSGRIRVMTEWLVPSSSQLDYDKLRKESLNYPEISTACLLVYVGHCTDLPGNSPKPSPFVKLSVIGRPDKKTHVKMFTKNPIFRQSFALPIGNPESDDLYINVYDGGPEQDPTATKNIGNLKVIVSRLIRRSNMEYLSQPFKLNNSGVESTITISLRLVYLKVWDGDISNKEDTTKLEDSSSTMTKNMDNDESFDNAYEDDDLDLKRVLSITHKSKGIPQSMSLDSFAGYSLFLSLTYLKDKNEDSITMTIQKLTNLDLSSDCHLYLSMVLLPETNKNLRQQTPKVRCTAKETDTTFGGKIYSFPISSNAFKTSCIEFKLKSGQSDISGKRMIGKGVTIGRSVIELQDLFVDQDSINKKSVEKIIPIHKTEKRKKSGLSNSGQGHKSLVKSSSTFSKFLRFGSKRSEEENSFTSSEDDEMDS